MSKEFIEAVRDNDFKRVKAHIEAGEDPSQLYGENPLDVTSPLHVALQVGNDKIFSTVLAAATNVNVIDSNKNTPLRIAIISSKDDRVQMLLDAGADVNLTGQSDGTTPLHDAALGDPEVLKLLLKKGADINKTDRAGQPPLASVRFGGSPENAEALIVAGAAQQLNYEIPQHTTQEFHQFIDGSQESVTRDIPAISLKDELRRMGPEMSAAIDRGIAVASGKQAAREAGVYNVFSVIKHGENSLQAKAALIVAEQARLTVLNRAKLDAARVAAKAPARVDPLAGALRDRARQAAEDLPAQPPIPIEDRRAAFVEAALRNAAGGVAGGGVSESKASDQERPQQAVAGAPHRESTEDRRAVILEAALRRQQERGRGGAASSVPGLQNGYPEGHPDRSSSPRGGGAGHGGGGVGGR